MEKPLFSGCEDFSILSFLLKIMHVKVICKITNMVDMMLQLLCEAFKHANFLKTITGQRNNLRVLVYIYKSIHAYDHNCALFTKENKDLNFPHMCLWVAKSTYGKRSLGRCCVIF